MDEQFMTPESILESGRQLAHKIVHLLPAQEVLSHYKSEEVLSHYKPEEVLSRYKPEEVFSRYSLSELEAYVKQRQREEKQNGH